MWWPFGKKKPGEQPKLTEDWQAGDVAECIEPLSDPTNRFWIMPGARFIVVEVALAVSQRSGISMWGLRFAGLEDWCEANSFRKIIPPAIDRKITRRAPVREDA